jgi:hypothetical protein
MERMGHLAMVEESTSMCSTLVLEQRMRTLVGVQYQRWTRVQAERKCVMEIGIALLMDMGMARTVLVLLVASSQAWPQALFCTR